MIHWLGLLSVLMANAAASLPSVKVSFELKGKVTEFLLVKEEKQFFLSKRLGKRLEKKEIGESQATFIQAESNRIMWESLYGKASSKKCHTYAAISVRNENAKVCLENRKAAGLTSDLLHSVNGNF
jgi:hypothetical protein